ncbi:MAG: hypothetical protein HC892_16220 [Saprospiraceae bacterium]|nr:hypothetical protein [Saprospiraceae bacterium]
MKHRFKLSPDLYAQMLDRINGLYQTDRLGFRNDLRLFEHDQWLCDAAVIERVSLHEGAWEVVLIFADFAIPIKFITRRITSNACPKKAAQMAYFMRRQAAKDQRGTINLSLEQFNLPLN